MMLKIYSIFLLLIGCSLINSQKKEVDKIYYYLNKSNETSGIDKLKSLEYAKSASLIAEKIGDSERKAKSYLFISKCLYILDNYKESFKYIEKGLREDGTKKDKILLSSFKEITASNYFATGLEAQGLKEYKEIITLLKSEKNEEAIRICARTYAMIAAIYLNQGKYALCYENIDKALKINITVGVEGHINERADLYNIKGQALLNDKKTDSALFYFKKSYVEIQKDNSIPKYIQYTSFGDYYYEIKQYQKALDFYLKTLDDLKKFNLEELEYRRDINKVISEIYGLLNNEKKENQYLLEYIKDNEILKKRNIQDSDAAVNSILNRKLEEVSFFKKRNNLLLIIISSLIILITVIYIIFKRKSIIKKKALQKAEHELLLKQEMILKKETEKKNLEYKLNDSFDEVIQLAKTNSPSFLTRFKEVYPEFCEKLIAMSPDILNSEFTFCAYLKLNFSTKEIANYTFVTEKAVQARKSRIRKKFNISSDEDLYTWVSKI